MVDFLLVLVERFLLALNIEALGADIGRNRCVQEGGHFERKFQGEWGVAHPTPIGFRKLECLGYHVALFA